MIRLTTPTFKFVLPQGLEYSAMVISFVQGVLSNPTVTVEKTLDDITFEEGSTACVTLTQEETKRFVVGSPVNIQIRVLTTTGKAYASEVWQRPVEDVLNQEILV